MKNVIIEPRPIITSKPVIPDTVMVVRLTPTVIRSPLLLLVSTAVIKAPPPLINGDSQFPVFPARPGKADPTRRCLQLTLRETYRIPDQVDLALVKPLMASPPRPALASMLFQGQ
jgi:hypothetical protein